MEASAPVICDRNSVRLESRRRKSWWGLGPSLPRRSGGGWTAKRLRPSRAGPTPTCGSRAAAPERGLVHRRRLQPSTSRRGCCSAAAAAWSPAGPEPGFPPPPRAGWLFSQGSTGLPSWAQLRSWGERRQRRLPHVSPGCPVSQQFPPGPQRRLRRCCHGLSHIPGLQRSRRRRRASPTTLSASAPCFSSPRRPGSAQLGRGTQRWRPQPGRQSPQPTIHRAAPPGREDRGPGRGECSPPRERGYSAGAAGICPERKIPFVVYQHLLSQYCTQRRKSTLNSTFPHDFSTTQTYSQEHPGAAFRLPWDWAFAHPSRPTYYSRYFHNIPPLLSPPQSELYSEFPK